MKLKLFWTTIDSDGDWDDGAVIAAAESLRQAVDLLEQSGYAGHVEELHGCFAEGEPRLIELSVSD